MNNLEQQEKNYEQSLERAQALLEFVLTQPEGVIKKLLVIFRLIDKLLMPSLLNHDCLSRREEVIATIYGYIGYAYLQMKDLQNAMIFFKKEKDLSLRQFNFNYLFIYINIIDLNYNFNENSIF